MGSPRLLPSWNSLALTCRKARNVRCLICRVCAQKHAENLLRSDTTFPKKCGVKYKYYRYFSKLRCSYRKNVTLSNIHYFLYLRTEFITPLPQEGNSTLTPNKSTTVRYRSRRGGAGAYLLGQNGAQKPTVQAKSANRVQRVDDTCSFTAS